MFEDAPWVHACGEDDGVFPHPRVLLLQRDGQCSNDAPWVHACGEDDGADSCEDDGGIPDFAGMTQARGN